jgi:hypothetical protein
LGGLIVPLIKNHVAIAKVIVNAAIKRGRKAPKQPRSIRLAMIWRGILPDFIFQRVACFSGIQESIAAWRGR